jgi:UDP-N-acetylmuramate: L-alanyl-gamma-D-glutamyl-meso-diaminopimelate ligase
VLTRGAWSAVERFAGTEFVTTNTGAAHASAHLPHWLIDDGGAVTDRGKRIGGVRWPDARPQLGRHNRLNALAAIAAARHVGVPPTVALEALAQFEGIKRRLETRGVAGGVTVYDDFAHHPTAIATTVDGLRRAIGNERILAVLEPRSNTMKLGAVKDALAGSLTAADMTFCYAGKLGWDPAAALAPARSQSKGFRRSRPPDRCRDRRSARRRSRARDEQRRLRRHPRQAAAAPRRARPLKARSYLR